MRKKINLSSLTNLEMKNTKAGYEIPEVCITPSCGCLCCYEGSGGSSSSVNCSANHLGGQMSYPC